MQDTIKKLTRAGYRLVDLACLFDSNVVIRPRRSNEFDNDAGWTDYPEQVAPISINGEGLTRLTEAFGIEPREIEVPPRGGLPRRFQHIKFMDIQLMHREMTVLDEDKNPVKLYALEHPSGSLQLAAEYEDGTWRRSSYRGRYDLHWTDSDIMEG